MPDKVTDKAGTAGAGTTATATLETSTGDPLDGILDGGSKGTGEEGSAANAAGGEGEGTGTEGTSGEGEGGDKEGEGGEGGEGGSGDTDTRLNELVAARAAEYGIEDISQASEREMKLLQILARQDLEAETGAGGDGEDGEGEEGDDFLTEFEKSSTRSEGGDEEEGKPEGDADKTKPATTTATAPVSDTDFDHPDYIAQPFKSAEHAYKLWSKTFRDVYGTPDKPGNQDFTSLDRVETRMFNARVVPYLEMVREQAVEETLSRLAPYLPALRETTKASLQQRARTTAIEQLQKLPQYKDLASVLYADTGKTVKMNGKEHKGTVINRVIAANPHLLDIHKTGKTPEESAVLTNIAILRAAYQIHKRSGLNKKQAKSLVESGKKMAASATRTAAHHKLNQGSSKGQSAAGSGNGYVDLIRNSDGGVRIEDI